jgi:hypothetical protein
MENNKKQTAVEFVTYELALRMKQLGHYDQVIVQVDNVISRPLYQQAFRWFREKHKLNGEVNYLPNVEKYGIITSDMVGMKPKDLSKKENFERGKKVTNNFVKYDTYEEAELACLEKLIEIVEQIKSE